MSICYDCLCYDETKTRQCTAYNNECQANEDSTHCCEYIARDYAKPIKYEGKDGHILLCCPTCECNIDWTYKTTVLGLEVLKWKNGKRRKCIHCGQDIDWSEYKGDIVEINH